VTAAFDPWRHRFAVVTAAATLCLIFVGGLVTSTGSGLSVPDWPLSYGMLMPPMRGGVFYEHGHRMVATTVGLLTLILAVWTARVEARRGVRRLGWAALAGVVAQGVLGGLTVLFYLPVPISVTHACVAQAFFCTTIALAYVTSREWLSGDPPREDAAFVRPAALVATGAVFVQLLLGALARHLGARLDDFPLASSRPGGDGGALPLVLHMVGAGVVFATVVTLSLRCERSDDALFTRLGRALFGLVLVQIGLGIATLFTGKAVTPTTLHVATGAAILGTAWLVALRAQRRLIPARASVAVPPLSGTEAPANP
jgi:cytochrome c oxidase assembly protein subunit 15